MPRKTFLILINKYAEYCNKHVIEEKDIIEISAECDIYIIIKY